MAKIDTSKIEGYADMTAEEKIAALESFNTPDPDYTGWVKKETLDKATHDAAEWKRKHNALLSEDERNKAEQADTLAAMQAELESLRKDKKISAYAAKLNGAGYENDLASAAAQALADGDVDAFFAYQTKFLDNYAKNIRAENMKNTPRPAVGAAPSGEPDYKKKQAEALENGDFALYAQLVSEEAAAAAE